MFAVTFTVTVLTLAFAFVSMLCSAIVALPFRPTFGSVFLKQTPHGLKLYFTVYSGYPKPIDLTVEFEGFKARLILFGESSLSRSNQSDFKDSIEVIGFSASKRTFECLVSDSSIRHSKSLTLRLKSKCSRIKFQTDKAVMHNPIETNNKLSN